MPSGSRSSGGGSHFSGGSNSGGGSGIGGGSHFDNSPNMSGRNRFNGRRPFRARPFGRGPRIYYFGGRSYRFSSKRQSTFSLLIFLLMFMIILSIVGGIKMNSASNEMEVIRADYNLYQTMIEHAEANPEYIVEGRITGIYLDAGHTKYYYTYEIETQYGSRLEGHTYYTYTLEDLRSLNLSNGATISVAVNSYPVTLSTDSMPMEYRNFALEDDEEYTMRLSTHRNGKIMLSVCASIAGVALIVAIIVFFTAKKEEKSVTTTTANQPTTSTNTTMQNQNRCPYCGTRISNTATKCPNCGAPRQYK